MTSSFNTDLSKFNYAKTTPDLSESMGVAINNNAEVMARHFQQQMEVNQLYLKAREKFNEDLYKLIPAGAKILKAHKQFKETKEFRESIGTDNETFNGINEKAEEAEKLKNERQKDINEKLKDDREILNSVTITSHDRDKAYAVNYGNTVKKVYEGYVWDHIQGATSLDEFTENFRNRVGSVLEDVGEDGLSVQQYSRHVKPKLDELYKELREKWSIRQGIFQEEAAVDARKEELFTDLKVSKDPGKTFVDWLNKYYPYHETRAESWGEGFKFLGEGLDEKAITDDIYAKIKDYSQKWSDGSNKTIGENRKEAGILDNRRKAIATAEFERRTAEIAEKSGAWLNANLSSIPLGELTLEKLLEIEVGYKKFLSDDLGVNAGDPLTEGQETINNLKTRLEKGSESAFNSAKIKFIKTGYVTQEDGRGITDPEDLEEFKKMLAASQKRISIEDATGKTKASITDWSKETFPDPKTQPPDYNVRLDALKVKAAEAYKEKRGNILLGNPNIDDNELHKQTLEAITPDFKDWFDGKVEDKTDTAAAIDFKVKLSKDSRLINLTVPLNDGELKVLTDNSARISRGEQIDYTFWRTNSTIKENGKTLSPYEIAQRRLIATGFIDEKTLEPIPERELVNTELQDLLLGKPSPANTLKVIAESEDPEWALKILNEPGLDSNMLYGHTLQQNMEQHKFGSIDMDWMKINVIDEDLINQYKEIVPDFNPWSSPQNMPPELATVQVEQKLTKPEFDMSTLGQPVDVQESFEQTGLYKAGLGTRDLVMSALTDDEGNLNAFGRMLERFFTGEGAEDVEAWVRTAPIGKIIDMLDDILDPSVLEQIEESTQ